MLYARPADGRELIVRRVPAKARRSVLGSGRCRAGMRPDLFTPAVVLELA